MYIYTLLLACSEPKETDTAPPVQEVVVYGTCSLETVSYDNNDHNDDNDDDLALVVE